MALTPGKLSAIRGMSKWMSGDYQKNYEIRSDEENADAERWLKIIGYSDEQIKALRA